MCIISHLLSCRMLNRAQALVIRITLHFFSGSHQILFLSGAKAREAVGVIIDGRCRDINEHKALGFPVFSRGRSTIGQSPWVRPSTINTSIRMSSIDVNPGDWIVADEDGVVRVPPVLEAQVVELALKGQEVDALCMEAIQKGEGIKASFKKFRGK